MQYPPNYNAIIDFAFCINVIVIRHSNYNAFFLSFGEDAVPTSYGAMGTMSVAGKSLFDGDVSKQHTTTSKKG